MAAKRQAQVIITANASVAERVMKELEGAATRASNRMSQLADDGARVKDQMRQLAAANKQNTDEYKNLDTQLKQINRDFKEAEKDFQAYNSRIKEGVKDSVRVNEVMKQLSKTASTDLKRALASATRELSKMSEDDKGRQKLINQIARIKEQISSNNGLTMSLKKAREQLKALDNTPMDKLKQGLQTLQQQYDRLSAKQQQSAAGQKLLAGINATKAQMAVNQAGPVSTAAVASMSATQLRAEQSRLQSVIGATAASPQFAAQTAAYEARLKEVNNQLKQLAENEKKADAAAKELQATQQAMSTVNAVNKGQKVSLDELTQAYKTLQAQYQKFAGTDPFKAKQAQQNMKLLEAEIKKLNGSLLTEEELQKRIGNTGKYSVKQLQEAYQALQAKLNNLNTSETAAIKATQMQMKNLQREINRATGQVSGFAKAWQTAKQNIMMYVGVFAIVNKIKSTISGLVEQNKALSDSMANIRKVSQWASSDVVKLTENLAKIDTRNTITTLQNLAYQGAKLGIGQYGVEGLTGFVRASEQVQTALGEDLGEEALPALAKLTEVMGLIPKFGVEQAMQKAGSAIYQLGATSTATGKNIVEFSKRIMGLANVAGISADQLLGLSAASDTMAIMPEVGATAFNKLFNSIHGNTEGIAKAVGIAKEELQSLLYEGRTMDALVKVFEKMQTMSMKELEGRGVFKELGSDGARLTNVMITMANKVDMLKSSLQTANEAFSEGKAVINEYLIQQETAAAYFERAANIWTKAFVNPEGVDIVKQLAQEWYNVSYEMTHSASTMAQIRLTLGMIAEAAKTLIQILPTLVQLMMAYGVGAALQNIYLQFRAIQVAATTAGGAMAKFNALMKTNALAFAITGVTFLIAKMYELSEASKAAAAEEEKRQKIFTDAAAEARQVYDEQRKALEKYQDALKDTNATEDERNDIIRKFKNEFGTYLEKLGIEINTYQDMESALRRVNKELKEKAYYETGQKLRESYVGDARSEQTNALSRYMQAAQKYSIPTTVMEDIMEGKITDPAKAIQQVYNNLYGKQYGTGGKLNWIPGKPYQYWVGDQSNVRTTIPTGGATGWVMDKLTGGQATQTEEIYNAVTNLVNATKEVNDRETQVTKFMDQYAGSYSPQISVDGAILNLKKLKQMNEDKLNEGLNVLRDAWKEMSEEERKADSGKGGKGIGSAIDAYSKQLRAMRGEGYTPPPTAKEQAKQEAERRKALRAEMKEEQTQAKAIIDNVRNYYQRQINAITEMANTTGMDPKMQEQMVNGMKERMNTALANVRKAIGGTKNEWDEFKQTMRQDLYEPLDENGTNLSTELLDKVMDNNLDQLRTMIESLSKELNQNGSVLLDQILRKASENEGINAKIENTLMRAREKELLEKNYTGKVDKDTEGVMEQFGIAAITDAQSRQIRDWSAQGNDPAIQRFLEMRTKYWQVAFGNARKNLVELIQADVSNQQGQESVLQLLFGEDWKEGLTGSELEGILNMTADQWQVFYMKLIEYTDNWTDAQKKAYDEVKKRQDYLFENSTDVMGLNSLEIGYQQQAKANSRWGKPQTFAERLGLGSLDNISNDPEVKMMEIKLTKAELYYKRMEELRKQDKISEEQLQTAKEQWASAQEALMDKIAEHAKEKMQQIQALLDPIKDFGAAAGEAMYMTVNGLDGEGEAWRNAIKSIIKTYGEMTIQMIEKQLIQMLVMKQHHQEQEDEEQAHQDRMKQIQGQGNNQEVNAQNILNAKIISLKKKGNKAEEKEDKSSEENRVDIAGQGGQTMLDLMAATSTGMVNIKKEEAQETQQIEQQQQATSLSGLISDTVAKVVLGIAGGSAKTISELGWWGLPLVAVISAALMGLLNYALSAIGSGSKQSNNNAAKTNVKLKSGMLTYDEGNVGMFAGRRKLYDDGTTQVYDREGSRPAPFVGQDGHVYMATPRGGIPEGVSLVKQPIATTVNGQPSLVAEKGPEIVIGRRTTARIMMNEPRLLHHLATLGNGRSYGGYRGLRTFDEGNLGDMVGGGRNNDITSSRNNEEVNAALAANAAALEQNAAAMAAFSLVMQQIQANGIQGVFREYGAGSLDESMRKVNAFRRRYPVG